MANIVKIAVIGPAPFEADSHQTAGSIAEQATSHWLRKLGQVLPDEPDLILLPEVCDRPAGLSAEEYLQYYRRRGNSVRDFFAGVASSNHCYVVYPGVREIEDGTFRNSSTIIGRDGSIAGIYDKNHVVIEETTEQQIMCGTEAPVFACDFGNVACAICFDLNFDELRMQYANPAGDKPDLILFSSMYHGGLAQQYWAYTCRAYFAGAIAGPPSEIRNPFGEVVARSTNYRDYAVCDINLDYCLAHIDYNKERLQKLKEQYGSGVRIHDPGLVGSVMISSFVENRSATQMAHEFGIELLNDYFTRARRHHEVSRG